MAALRLLLVADDPLVRAGLAAVLAEAESCDVVGQSSAGEDVLQAQELFAPDVVLWDLGWEPMTDFALLADFAESAAPLLVLLDDINLVSSVWAAGARGVLQRQIELEQLESALAALWQGLAVLSPALGARLGAATPLVTLMVEELTAREMDVLQLMAEGAANKEIARNLGISENTVKYHVNAILGKLDAQSRTEAVVRATRAGLILL